MYANSSHQDNNMEGTITLTIVILMTGTNNDVSFVTDKYKEARKKKIEEVGTKGRKERELEELRRDGIKYQQVDRYRKNFVSLCLLRSWGCFLICTISNIILLV